MSKSLVLDTNVLVHAVTQDEPYYGHCLLIISLILSHKLIVGVDVEGIILDEYFNKLKENYKFIMAKNLLEFFSKFRYKRVSHKLPISTYFPINENKIKYLISNNFHKKDIIFVRIAPQTDLKIIISSDSRSLLDKNFSKWIKNNLNVDVMHPKEFVNNKIKV